MSRVQRVVVAAAAAVAVLFAAFLLLEQRVAAVLPADAVGAVSNLVQLVVPLLAAVVCLDSSRRQPERRQRRAWLLLALGVGAWGSGQAVYAWYELVRHAEVPLPSVADVGFLGFPVLAAAAAFHVPRRALSAAIGVRSVLDGLVIATSLLVTSWVVSLQMLWDDGGASVGTLVLTTAYPVGDVVLLTVVLLLVAGVERVRRSVLVPLALGLASFAVADSGYVYATSSGTYSSGALFDLGWVCGFLLMAVSAVAAHPTPGAGRGAARTSADRGAETVRQVHPWSSVLLPYLSPLVAGAVLLAQLRGGSSLTRSELVLAAVLVVLVLGRQFVALADNRTLLAQLHEQHDLARHQALHDSLTGLANRALFMDRVTHALALNRRDGGETTVLFCDLDDFKLVNDLHGHAVGDEVLVEAARRLTSELREQDTVARLGGDEFAVLLERSPDPAAVAQKLVAALSQPVGTGADAVAMSVSIGVATAGGGEDVSTDELLRRADRAMYLTKADGKAGWRLVTPDDTPVRPG